jgi:transposase
MLIDEVMRRNQSINSSAKKIGIKYSTAKLIIKRFRETGTIIVRNIKRTPSIRLS